MQTIHDLLDGRVPVPPMDIKDVDVRGAELLQAVFKTDVHRLDTVPSIVCLLNDLSGGTFVVRRILEVHY